MDDEIYVSCHAPSLSLLLYETARSVHDQKGLLVGQICNEVISKKTDENEVNCERKTAIYLEHCIPIDDSDAIGNGGIINKNELQKYIDSLDSKIIGWYSFRRNSRLVPSSLSEMLIHQSLLELIPNTKCQYFVACFMSSSVSANKSTHTFNHVFMTYDPLKGKFEPVRLKIHTLSDKSVNSNGYSVRNPLPTSSIFDSIINYVQKEETPVESVLAIQKRVSEALKYLDKKLRDTDNRRLELEQEVKALKKKLGSGIYQEIVIQEPPKEELTIETIRFDPNVRYNPNRKTNPLNSNSGIPTVPADEKVEGRRKSDNQRKNHFGNRSGSPGAGPRKTEQRIRTPSGPSSCPTLQPFSTKPPKNKRGLSPFAGHPGNRNVVEALINSENDCTETKTTDSSTVHVSKPMEH